MSDFFRLEEHGTNFRTELVAGLTTFLTMAYIAVVNPQILSATGMDQGALLTVTCLAAALATSLMALFTNYPFALAPGMGLNAFFAFTVVIGLEISWEVALAVVFLEGLIFIALTLMNVREALVNAMPEVLKVAVSAGIGLFLALIGMKNAGLVVDHPVTLVTRGDLTQVGPMLAALGLAVTAGLHARNVRGALLWGILFTAVAGWASGAAPPPEGLFSAPPSPWPIVGKLDISGALALPKFELFAILLGFFFVDFFDTLGTLVGVSSKAGYLDEEGRLPHAKGAFMADALGTTLGAAMGTSTVTTFVESAAGVRVGGRTGLTGMVVAACFLVSPFFAPVLLAIPPFATAPALIMVGLFMAEGLAEVDFTDPEEGLPAFLTVVVMPFTFSISEGIVAGVLGFVGVKFLAGNGRDVPVGLWVLAVVFALRLALLKG